MVEQEGRRMTNAEKMIELLKANDAEELLDWWQEIFEDGVPQADYFQWWLGLHTRR